jgi:hypothetical protein
MTTSCLHITFVFLLLNFGEAAWAKEGLMKRSQISDSLNCFLLIPHQPQARYLTVR